MLTQGVVCDFYIEPSSFAVNRVNYYQLIFTFDAVGC